MSNVSPLKVTEGTVDFNVPGIEQPCKTWYKIFGDLENRSHRPLVGLHGGPGVTHHYLLTLSGITQAYNIPLILYDQLGNGSSTHLREKNGDTEFWVEKLFRDELDNLLTHLGIQDDYDLLGHSWGGMLASAYSVRQPKGMKHLIIASSPASMPLWVEAQAYLRGKLPQDVQDVLNKHEDAGTIEDQEYKDAVQVYYENYLCRVKPFPKVLQQSFKEMEDDSTVYLTM
jgi:proline-specific peptidase